MNRDGEHDPILLTGAGGLIGSRILELLNRGQDRCVVSSRGPNPVEFDLETPGALRALVEKLRPRVVIHGAAISAIAACESDPKRAHRVNTAATLEIADAARAVGARLIFFSTDQVFDGRAGPCDEDSAAAPLHVYGKTKRAAESALLAEPADRVILRPSLVFGRSPSGRRSASEMVLNAAGTGRELDLFVDEYRRPVSVAHVARVTVALVASTYEGLLHLSGPELLSRHQFGLEVCRAHGLDPEFIRAAQLSVANPSPSRPATIDLCADRCRRLLGFEPRPLDESLRAER